MPHVCERARVEQVDLEPEQVERLEGLGDANAALGLEVEVQVDDRSCRIPGALAKRLEQKNERIGDLLGTERSASLVEPRHEHFRVVAGNDDVRLECAVAVLDDLAAERDDVVVASRAWASR